MFLGPKRFKTVSSDSRPNRQIRRVILRKPTFQRAHIRWSIWHDQQFFSGHAPWIVLWQVGQSHSLRNWTCLRGVDRVRDIYVSGSKVRYTGQYSTSAEHLSIYHDQVVSPHVFGVHSKSFIVSFSCFFIPCLLHSTTTASKHIRLCIQGPAVWKDIQKLDIHIQGKYNKHLFVFVEIVKQSIADGSI